MKFFFYSVVLLSKLSTDGLNNEWMDGQIQRRISNWQIRKMKKGAFFVVRTFLPFCARVLSYLFCACNPRPPHLSLPNFCAPYQGSLHFSYPLANGQTLLS